jgi:hypothetical protein
MTLRSEVHLASFFARIAHPGFANAAK